MTPVVKLPNREVMRFVELDGTKRWHVIVRTEDRDQVLDSVLRLPAIGPERVATLLRNASSKWKRLNFDENALSNLAKAINVLRVTRAHSDEEDPGRQEGIERRQRFAAAVDTILTDLPHMLGHAERQLVLSQASGAMPFVGEDTIARLRVLLHAADGAKGIILGVAADGRSQSWHDDASLLHDRIRGALGPAAEGVGTSSSGPMVRAIVDALRMAKVPKATMVTPPAVEKAICRDDQVHAHPRAPYEATGRFCILTG